MKTIQDHLVIIILFILILIPLSQSYFIVNEGEIGILLRFKKVIGEEVNDEVNAKPYAPGIHIKIPFVDQPVIMSTKLQTVISDDNIDTQTRSPIGKEDTLNMIEVVNNTYQKIKQEEKYDANSLTDLFKIFQEKTESYIYTDMGEFLSQFLLTPDQKAMIKKFDANIDNQISMFELGKLIVISANNMLNPENKVDIETVFRYNDNNDEITTKYLNTNFYIKYKLDLDNPKSLAQFYTWTRNGKFENATTNVYKHVKSQIKVILKNSNITRVIQGGIRDEIAQTLKEKLNDEYINSKNWGIKIVDIRLKKIDYPDAARTAVHERMKSEQVTQSAKILAQGEAEKMRLKATADTEVEEVIQDARVVAKIIEAKAYKTATYTYNTIHKKHPDLFELLYSLDAIDETIKPNDAFIISDDAFFYGPLTINKLANQ